MPSPAGASGDARAAKRPRSHSGQLDSDRTQRARAADGTNAAGSGPAPEELPLVWSSMVTRPLSEEELEELEDGPELEGLGMPWPTNDIFATEAEFWLSRLQAWPRVASVPALEAGIDDSPVVQAPRQSLLLRRSRRASAAPVPRSARRGTLVQFTAFTEAGGPLHGRCVWVFAKEGCSVAALLAAAATHFVPGKRAAAPFDAWRGAAVPSSAAAAASSGRPDAAASTPATVDPVSWSMWVAHASPAGPLFDEGSMIGPSARLEEVFGAGWAAGAPGAPVIGRLRFPAGPLLVVVGHPLAGGLRLGVNATASGAPSHGAASAEAPSGRAAPAAADRPSQGFGLPEALPQEECAVLAALWAVPECVQCRGAPAAVRVTPDGAEELGCAPGASCGRCAQAAVLRAAGELAALAAQQPLAALVSRAEAQHEAARAGEDVNEIEEACDEPLDEEGLREEQGDASAALMLATMGAWHYWKQLVSSGSPVPLLPQQLQGTVPRWAALLGADELRELLVPLLPPSLVRRDLRAQLALGDTWAE